MQNEVNRLKREGFSIALVPTMGALHGGHLSLLAEAKKHAHVIILSIYVNPTQFAPGEDFKRYPRNLTKDIKLISPMEINYLFAPRTLYSKNSSTEVQETEVSQGRCGKKRKGHFTGVTTVVSKLFNITQPDVALFGQKDAQQCDVIERMIQDLHYPIRMIRAPIVRDGNGVAMSSRNQYLRPGEYKKAIQFATNLREVASSDLTVQGKVQALKRRLKEIPGLRLEYVERVNKTLCAAVYIGKTRLIDNRFIRPGKKAKKTKKMEKNVKSGESKKK